MTAAPSVEALAHALDHVLPVMPAWVSFTVVGVGMVGSFGLSAWDLFWRRSTRQQNGPSDTVGRTALLLNGACLAIAFGGMVLLVRHARASAERSAVLALAGPSPTAWFRVDGWFDGQTARIVVAKLPADTSPAGILAAGNSVWVGSVTVDHLQQIERELGGPGTLLRPRQSLAAPHAALSPTGS